MKLYLVIDELYEQKENGKAVVFVSNCPDAANEYIENICHPYDQSYYIQEYDLN